MQPKDQPMEDSPVSVAVCQIFPRIGDVEGNRRRLLEETAAAAAAGARIIVLPELVTSGYVFASQEEARSLAEHADGPTVQAVAALTRELDVVVVLGLPEIGPDGSLHNSAVVVDCDGLRATYRKTHLWDREDLTFTAGSQPPPVVDTGGRRIAVLVCYDLEFPEWVRLAALAGADLLCVPANWPAGPRPQAERPAEMVRALAAASTNRMFVAVCDRVGDERGVEWVGGSLIANPDGYPLAVSDLTGQEQRLLASCRLEDARDKTVSQRNDVLQDRRPELYHAVTRGSTGSVETAPGPPA
jgi:predicted amidohydrolase